MIAGFAFAAPYRSSFNKLMRDKPPFPFGKLAEIVHFESGYLSFLFWGSFPYNHCQSAFWSHFYSTFSFSMIGNSLFKESFSNKSLSCAKWEYRVSRVNTKTEISKTLLTLYTNKEAICIQPMIMSCICSGWVNNLQKTASCHILYRFC